MGKFRQGLFLAAGFGVAGLGILLPELAFGKSDTKSGIDIPIMSHPVETLPATSLQGCRGCLKTGQLTQIWSETSVLVAQEESDSDVIKIEVGLRAALQEDIELAEAEKLNQKAFQLYQEGKYSEAILLAEKALAIRQRILGQEHPDVATSLNNLAFLYYSQGRYEKAESLYQQALEILKRILGPEHPYVASSLNNLAALYNSQGKYEEAQPLYHQALEMLKRILGPEHPNIASSLNNLAALYNSQGRYEEAEPLYRQALEMRRRILGQQHPDVAMSLNDLAGLYNSQGRYEEALLLSGLILAGFRSQQSGSREDGILTAQEVSSLDLVGTKLVVLSACDTGLGKLDAAEGLYSLRRALVI
ncbi:MAG: tetratricopeptide repeat protein, partial [Symploca sp. SIO2E6]|nr:tetratricopeptide repeat protein [Symploca sp. SIO2E6]